MRIFFLCAIWSGLAHFQCLSSDPLEPVKNAQQFVYFLLRNRIFRYMLPNVRHNSPNVCQMFANVRKMFAKCSPKSICICSKKIENAEISFAREMGRRERWGGCTARHSAWNFGAVLFRGVRGPLYFCFLWAQARALYGPGSRMGQSGRLITNLDFHFWSKC